MTAPRLEGIATFCQSADGGFCAVAQDDPGVRRKSLANTRGNGSCFIGAYDDGRLAVPEMTGLEPLPERVDRIERKIDMLSESVDRRFDEVSVHFVEQRQYMEFAFDRLRGEMLEGFSRIERRLDGLERRLDGFEQKFESFEQKFERFERTFEGLAQTFEGFARTFDQFIESQSTRQPRRRPRRVQKKR